TFLTTDLIAVNSRKHAAKTLPSYECNNGTTFPSEITTTHFAINRECRLPVFLIPNTESVTLLIIIAINRADIIELNYATALAFLPNSSFDYVVFDHSFSSQPEITQTINNTCKQLNVKYIRVPRFLEKGGPSASHSATVQWIIQKHASKHRGRVWFLDVDMFFLNDWVWEEVMPSTKYDIMTVWQRRPRHHVPGPYIFYIWPNFFVFREIQAIPNISKLTWKSTTINGQSLDSGGETYFWINAHPKVRIKGIWQTPYGIDGDLTGSQTQYYRQTPQMIEKIHRNPDLFQLIWPKDPIIAKTYDHAIIGDFHILHYRAASNWNHASHIFAIQKWARIKGAVMKALSDKKTQNNQELEDYHKCQQQRDTNTFNNKTKFEQAH
ncbi:unnamed protein product, partial [Rotaria socialis]